MVQSLWRLLIEITVPPEDFSGSTLGFMNVVTWAGSAAEAEVKTSAYLRTFQWQVLGVDQAHLVDELPECSDELEEMIERAGSNEHAIVLGTFHSYPAN